MGNSKTDTQIKIYENSECFKCVLKFTTPLKIITNSITKIQVIACEDCIKVLKENAKK